MYSIYCDCSLVTLSDFSKLSFNFSYFLQFLTLENFSNLIETSLSSSSKISSWHLCKWHSFYELQNFVPLLWTLFCSHSWQRDRLTAFLLVLLPPVCHLHTTPKLGNSASATLYIHLYPLSPSPLARGHPLISQSDPRYSSFCLLIISHK